MKEKRGERSRTVGIALVGNPNCGKTTVFNRLTGSRFKTANRPGVTVDMKEGICVLPGAENMRIIDLPGTYSLTPYSEEERVTLDVLTSDAVDIIVNIVDLTSPERGFYLTYELLRLGKPTVIALNMCDVAKKRGISVDFDRLIALVGCPAVGISGRRGTGLDRLIAAVSAAKALPIPTACRIPGAQRASETVAAAITGIKNDDFTDRVDQVLIHRIFGLPICFAIMAAVFFLTFAVGGAVKPAADRLFLRLSEVSGELLRRIGCSDTVMSLVCDGIIGTLGGVISFLPDIFIMFLLIALLEDCGYMARCAYLTERMMSRIGLSGRAFLPMLLGLGCTVPAVMATRTLETEGERVRTVGAIPFLPCSARLPVFIMISRLFFGRFAAPVAFSLYLLGFAAAMIYAFVTSRRGGKRNLAATLLTELPEYRMPSPASVAACVGQRVGDYLSRAATVIFLSSLVLWFLRSFGMSGRTAMQNSFAGMIGKAAVPLLAPCGLGYPQITLAIASGLVGKENIVASLCLLCGRPENVGSVLCSLGFTRKNAYSMLLFILFSPPCLPAITAAAREMRSFSRAAGLVLAELCTAWTVSAIFYFAATAF